MPFPKITIKVKLSIFLTLVNKYTKYTLIYFSIYLLAKMIQFAMLTKYILCLRQRSSDNFRKYLKKISLVYFSSNMASLFGT